MSILKGIGVVVRPGFGLLAYLQARGHRNDLLTHPAGRLFLKSRELNVRTIPLIVRNDLDLRAVPKLQAAYPSGDL